MDIGETINRDDYSAHRVNAKDAAVKTAAPWKKTRRLNFKAYMLYKNQVIEDHVKMKLMTSQFVAKYYASRHTSEKVRDAILDNLHTLKYLKHLRKALK